MSGIGGRRVLLLRSARSRCSLGGGELPVTVVVGGALLRGTNGMRLGFLFAESVSSEGSAQDSATT